MHVTPDVGPASYGVGPVVLQIAREQIGLGQQVSVWATAANGVNAATIQRFRNIGPRRLAWSPSLEHAAKLSAQSGIDVVHQHSVLLPVASQLSPAPAA